MAEVAYLREGRAGRERRTGTIQAGLALALLMAFLLSAGWGAVSLSPGDILAILGRALGLGGAEVGEAERVVFLSIRLPRILLGGAVGAGLAVAGSALQGLFRNPLADPGLIGVSSGAALAAALVIVLGSAVTGALLPAGVLPAGTLSEGALPALLAALILPLAAFAGGLGTTLLLYRLARHGRQTDVATLLLAGIAFNAIAGAGLGLLVFASDDRQMRDLNFWLLGSLGGVTWELLLPALPLILAPTLALLLLARPLNALLLGEVEAQHLGFSVERIKRLVVVLAALAVGASVGLTGVIGFVGLVVPHLARLLIGADHRRMMPVAIVLGAVLLLIADLFARTLVLPAELPIGVLTSFIGGPFFLWLLLRRRARRGL